MRNIINKIKHINIILCFSLITGFAYARTETITIKFENAIGTSHLRDDNNYMLSAKLENYKMPCTGEDGSYHVSKTAFEKGTDLTDDKQLQISVDGKYDGDKRKVCDTKDDNVYFTLSDLVIDFDYKGKDYKCYINQNIGFSYDRANGYYNKLQGDIKNKNINCDPTNNSPFDYKLKAGDSITGPGDISIFRNSDLSEKDSARINIFSFNPDIKNYLFESSATKMSCTGQHGFSIDKYLHTDAAVEIKGVFKDDDRVCKLPTDNMYYILNNAKVNFEYNGEPKTCQINAQFGTSYDHLHLSYNKLQSYIPANPYGKSNKEIPNECIGAPGFFYRIVQGNDLTNSKYNPGYILLYKGNYDRPSKLPMSWDLYVNGIYNTIDDAMASSLAVSTLGPKSTDDTIAYGFLFNMSNGVVKDVTDLENMKLFDDKLAKGDYLPLYEQIYGPCPTADSIGYQQCKDDALNWYLMTVYSTESGAEQLGLKSGSIYGSSFDTVWASFLNYGVESSDRVLFIAHSQGNLYANSLVNYLVANRHYPRSHLNTIHVGNTSTMLSVYTDDLFKQIFPESMPLYLTNVEDFVIKSWTTSIKTLGGTLPPPANISYKDEPYLDYSAFDKYNHEFLLAYLNHKSTKDAFTNLLTSYTAYNEIMQRNEMPANYTGIYVYEISKDLKSENGYRDYKYDPLYAESSAKPNFAIYKASENNTLLSNNNDVLTILKDPSHNIQGFELKNFGQYSFDASSSNVRYVISNTNSSSKDLYCPNEPYIMILSSTEQKVICRNSNRQIVLPFQAASAIGMNFFQ